MTPTELIAAIDIIKAKKLEDIKSRISVTSNSSFFIVIKNDDSVVRISSVSFIFSGDFRYAFFIVDFGYMQQQVWSKNSWELAGFITPNAIITSIEGDKWSLTNIYFGFTNYGSMAPSFVMSLKDDSTKETIYHIQPDQFDQAWQFFREIDKECNTPDECALYSKYFKERINTRNQQLSIEQYKADVANKESVITQYQELLKLIEKRLTKTD